MAADYVGGITGAFLGSTTALTVAINSGLTGGSGSGASAGDLVLVCVGHGHQAGTPPTAITTPTGYSPLTVQNADSSSDTRHQVSYKVMGGTPDTSVDIPASGDVRWATSYSIRVYSGVDGTTPLDVTSTYATGTGTGRANPAAITPTTPGALVVVFGSGAAATISADYTSSDLSAFASARAADNLDSIVGSGHYAWTSGSFDPAQFGGGSTGAGDSWVATTLALRPSSGGGSTVKTLAALGVG